MKDETEKTYIILNDGKGREIHYWEHEKIRYEIEQGIYNPLRVRIHTQKINNEEAKTKATKERTKWRRFSESVSQQYQRLRHEKIADRMKKRELYRWHHRADIEAHEEIKRIEKALEKRENYLIDKGLLCK